MRWDRPSHFILGGTGELGVDCCDVAIVGGGCSGLLVAAQLFRQGFGGSVAIVEPRAELGRGLAYSTPFDDHLLNVPAGKMSAFPEEPEHFLNWLYAREWPGAAPGLFAPRRIYGEYLSDLLAQYHSKIRHVRSK